MTSYVLRRLLQAVLILVGASFLVYLLVAYSGDPLETLRTSTNPNRAQLIAARVRLLHLDVAPPLRFFLWFGGAARCVVPFLGGCDLGKTLQGQPVSDALSQAIPTTLQLVTGAEVLAIVIGITIGIVTALRQYSGLDYAATFVTFLFFSLPIFWVAVLLKEFGAIQFNNFLADPYIPNSTIALVSVVSGLLWVLLIGGTWRRRGITFVAAAAITGVVLFYLSVSRWFLTPSLGFVVVAVTGVAIAFGATSLLAGLKNRRALYASLTTVVLGLVVEAAAGPLLARATIWMILILGVLAVGAGWLAGRLFGGYDPGQSAKAAALTSFGVASLVLLDRFMQAWPSYLSNELVRGRPVATIGAATPNLSGDFWIMGIDKFTHLALPTVALILISIATYTRYSRASMLEVMSQDYVRTARAKGLSERVTVTRHAFRNALIPLATVIALDIGALIGGAVVTESVFSFKGMGVLFIQGIQNVDPNPVMGVFLVTGITAMVFNLIADLIYTALDPRVRVKA